MRAPSVRVSSIMRSLSNRLGFPLLSQCKVMLSLWIRISGWELSCFVTSIEICAVNHVTKRVAANETSVTMREANAILLERLHFGCLRLGNNIRVPLSGLLVGVS